MPDLIAGLACSYLFEDLSPADLEPLAATVSVVHLPRGAYAWHAGDPANEIYVVISGELKATEFDVDGNETIHFIIGRGMTTGEPGYFSVERDRQVDLIAVEQSTLLVISRRHLAPFMNRYPSTKDRALEGLASTERWQSTIVVSRTTWPVADRVALRLIELIDASQARIDGLPVTPKISQTTLAAMVGVTRENTNRGVAVLVAEGLVRVDNGRYVVLDEPALRRRISGNQRIVRQRDRRRD